MSADSTWRLPGGLELRSIGGDIGFRFKPDAPWLVLTPERHLHELRVVIDCIDDAWMNERAEHARRRLENAAQSMAALATAMESTK